MDRDYFLKLALALAAQNGISYDEAHKIVVDKEMEKILNRANGGARSAGFRTNPSSGNGNTRR